MRERGKKEIIFLVAFALFFTIFFINLTESANLPTVGGDTDTWGGILNSYLQTEHNADGTHGNITSTDIKTKGPVTDVRAFGAVGDGATDDTTEIQAAMDYVEAQGGGTLFFPRGTYIISSTINWKNGVRLLGEQSGFFVSGRYPEIRWNGAINGTMFLAEQINDNWQMTDAERLVFRGSSTAPSSINPGIIIDFQDRVDYEVSFWKCQFANSNGDAIFFRQGASNFHMYDFRADGIGGYLIHVNASHNGTDMYTLDKFTYDNGATADVGAGLIFMDGFNAPDNAVKKISVSNTRIEVNANLSGDNNSIILLGVNPAISDYVQYNIALSNILLASASATENFSLIRSYPASDQFTVTGASVQVGSKDIIINNSITAGPTKGKMHPFFVFAPFVSGSPAESNELISLIGRLYTVGNIGIGTTSPTEDLHVNGSFRVENQTGTLSLYVNESVGSVGIGTTSPEIGGLTIFDSVAPSIYLNRTGTREWRVSTDSAGSFLIQMLVPTVTPFRIDTAGRFGLGLNDTLPDTQIDVGASGSGILNVLKLRNAAGAAVNQGPRIVFSSRTANTTFATISGIAGIITNTSDTQPRGALTFYTYNGTTLGEKMRIDSDGILILTPNSTSMICSASTEGGMMYSNSTKKHYGCNGTDWNAFY